MSHDDQQAVRVRRRGRPRASEPGIAVGSWLRVSEFDRLSRFARERDQSVSRMVRVAILRLTKERGPV